jgi:hypothetical protein
MKNTEQYIINTHNDYGVSITVNNKNLADSLDDYLTENFFILYNIKDESAGTQFLFGQAASESKLKDIMTLFFNEN